MTQCCPVVQNLKVHNKPQTPKHILNVLQYQKSSRLFFTKESGNSIRPVQNKRFPWQP